MCAVGNSQQTSIASLTPSGIGGSLADQGTVLADTGSNKRRRGSTILAGGQAGSGSTSATGGGRSYIPPGDRRPTPMTRATQ